MSEPAMNLTRATSDPSLQDLDPHVREVIRSAERELRELLLQRAEVMKRIGTIRQTVAGLASLFGEEMLDEELLELVGVRAPKRRSGFTRACRCVLMQARIPLSAREVCEVLGREYPEMLLRHKDAIASVTTVLTRLVDYAEAQCFVNADGKRVWRWAAERPPFDEGCNDVQAAEASEA